jgi:hypothetical protein
MCLGVWTATVLTLGARGFYPEQILAVAGLGHILFLLRARFLPCDACKVQNPIPFKLVGVK